MTRTHPILLGVDVGTSNTKVLATTLDGRELAVAATPTKWTSRRGGQSDTDPEGLAAAAITLMAEVATAAADQVGPVQVAGAGFTGMAEAGVLLGVADRPVAPIIAWFDPRGSAEMLATPAEFREQFAGRTGLPCGSMPTLAKLLWLRGTGALPGRGLWCNVPEFVAHRLGAAPATEWSLASRTGLLDQRTGGLWPAAVDLIDSAGSADGAGRDGGLIPPRVYAGTPLGRAGGDIPDVLRGAVLTVAGHDHPVAAVGSGAVGPTDLFDSFGTAEAFVRAVDVALTPDARTRLAALGITSGRHVLAGRSVVMAGSKAGLLLRRTLALLDAADPAGRDRLDLAALARLAEPDRSAGVAVSGADNTDGVLRITVDGDDAGPADLWLATLAHVIDESERLLAAMTSEVGPSENTVIAGGWTRMASVRRAKSASLPQVRYSERSQAGAFGAALFAAHAVDAAAVLAATGTGDAIGVAEPTGPAPDFAAAFAAGRLTPDLADAVAAVTTRAPEETRT